ncbi:MAG: transcriptional repressor [Eubacteriales bacterium]|nr:transcriptional repressor [Eubacteriales bacterium]
MKTSYATSSRKNILTFLQKNSDKTVTVSDISAYLKSIDHDVNLTTIYRYLDKLIADGNIIKYVDEKGKKAVFQYVQNDSHCEDHLHLKCTACGRVIHMDCHFMEEISSHVKSHHHFAIQCKNSIIYGLCDVCSAKNE